MKPRKAPKKVSVTGAVYKELDRLWFQILKLERGETDQIDDRPGNALGTFHILCKGNHPRLRYCRENCLLVNWMPHHYNWHHYTSNDRQYQEVERGVISLRGENYVENLRATEFMMPKHNLTYLKGLKIVFKLQLKELEKEKT